MACLMINDHFEGKALLTEVGVAWAKPQGVGQANIGVQIMHNLSKGNQRLVNSILVWLLL